MWRCKKCKEEVEASKKIEIYRAPPILFLNLKRFKSSSGSYYKDKLEDKVTFPLEELDLSDRILSNIDEEGNPKEKIVYRCYAVSNHYGNMGFGHYTAYAQNHKTGAWYDFDDSHVSPISEDSVNSDAAYNLFYIRKDFDEKEPSLEEIKQTVDSEKMLSLFQQICAEEEAEDKLLRAQ